MSKKIIPILSVLTAGLLFGGCNFTIAETKQNNENKVLTENLTEFKTEFENANKVSADNLNKIAYSKYRLSLVSPEIDNLAGNYDADDKPSFSLQQAEPNLYSETLLSDDNAILRQKMSDNADNLIASVDGDKVQSLDNSNDLTSDNLNYNQNVNVENLGEQIKIDTELKIDDNQSSENQVNDPTNNQTDEISTLYSLSEDVEGSCEQFCALKKSLSDAIVETQNLINKVQNKEIELTLEQRIYLTEQSKQLKSLGKQLSASTTELNIYLSDLNQLLSNADGNLDKINLKYLMVLDNLVNGNEMLENSLNSLNLINTMFNMRSSALPESSRGRVLYGFQHNNEAPIIKDYYIDENGKMKENNVEIKEQQENVENSENDNNNQESNNEEETKKTNIDTYKNTKLNSNIDTYYGNNRHNIDSFFNTALLDNEFMYGGNGYGYNNPMMYGAGYNNMAYPNGAYLNNQNLGAPQNNAPVQTNNENTNTKNSVDNQDNTQNVEKKTKRKKKINKNIDTYKNEDTPSVKEKLGRIKSNVSEFFSKFRPKNDDKVKNPVYRFDASSEESE